MSETRVIGSGTVRDVHWTLEAGGDDEGYWTGLEVRGSGEYLCSGGMAGPKLWGHDLICCYGGRSDEGPLGIVVRANPTVMNVLVCTVAGEESELLPCGEGIIDGLRFYLGFAWPHKPLGEFGLDRLRALDDDGTEVASEDLSFWDRRR